MYIFAGPKPNCVAQGKEGGLALRSNGKVTQGMRAKGNANKGCGNKNLSFVKHQFNVLPSVTSYSLSCLKTELLIKMYLKGNCQAFENFKLLTSFTVSASKLTQLFIPNIIFKFV